MPWLADSDVAGVHCFVRALVEARTRAELRQLAHSGLFEAAPVDVLTWDRVELATGAVRHTALPDGAEPGGAFAAVVGDAAGHGDVDLVVQDPLEHDLAVPHVE